MTGKGKITSTPKRNLRLMLFAQLGWILTVCLLGAWWLRLVLRQAATIAELQGKLGLAADMTQGQWARTQHMVHWESLAFFTLLLASTALVCWLYWRDIKRARALQAFFASVTHELRTPLTSIRLQAESIAENLAKDPSQKELLDRLLEDTQRLESQVERTLELARVEGGGPVFLQVIHIKPWLDRLIKSWEETYAGKVGFDAKVDDVLVQGDPVAIQVILKNLLENSIRHAKREQVEVSIRAQAERDGVSLLFRDNGEAFEGDVSELGKIFNRGPTSQGAGVGLYLVKMLMSRMGGSAHFQAHEGFEVALRFREGRSHA